MQHTVGAGGRGAEAINCSTPCWSSGPRLARLRHSIGIHSQNSGGALLNTSFPPSMTYPAKIHAWEALGALRLLSVLNNVGPPKLLHLDMVIFFLFHLRRLAILKRRTWKEKYIASLPGPYYLCPYLPQNLILW